MTRNDGPTHYEVLGITEAATAEEIHAAYRELAKKTHPDVGGARPLFVLIRTAFEVLSDPARRAEYDTRRYNDRGAPYNGPDPYDDRMDRSATGDPSPWPIAPATPGRPWDARDDSLLAAIELALALAQGWQPPRPQTNLWLQQDEYALFTYPIATASVFCEMDVEYAIHDRGWSGGLIGLGSMTITAARNARERARARELHRAQWRVATSGALTITNYRLSILGVAGPVDYWFNGIAAEQFGPGGIELHYPETHPQRIDCASPDWLYVAFQWAARRHVHRFPIPSDLRERAQQAGRPLSDAFLKL
jgi:curved DNA-binding protein CbpA